MSSYDGLPPKLKLGAVDIRLSVQGRVSRGKDWGTYTQSKYRIALDKKQPNPSVAAGTLLHEILHAIWHLSEMEGDDDVEEKTISAFTPFLIMLFRDNPELMKWLQDATK